jgi:hypothetical protein
VERAAVKHVQSAGSERWHVVNPETGRPFCGVPLTGQLFYCDDADFDKRCFNCDTNIRARGKAKKPPRTYTRPD